MALGIFRRGVDSSDEGAKILFLGYFHCQKPPKNSFSPFDRGANMYRRDIFHPPLAPTLFRLRIAKIYKQFKEALYS